MESLTDQYQESKAVPFEELQWNPRGGSSIPDGKVAWAALTSLVGETEELSWTWFSDGVENSEKRSKDLLGVGKADCTGPDVEINTMRYADTKQSLVTGQTRPACKPIQPCSPAAGSSVKSLHTFRDMSNFSFPLANGSYIHTCPAALGYPFAGGTSDGPGAFDFTQNGPNAPNASPETDSPYLWTPNIVDVQVLRVGQLVIIVTIHDSAPALALSGSSSVNPVVVIGGPANSYTHYIATTEEYGIQRCEGVSTLHGPYTQNTYPTLSYLRYLSSLLNDPIISPVRYGCHSRRHPLPRVFGEVKTDVESAYAVGDIVPATFVGANPRISLRLEQTQAAFEKLNTDSKIWEGRGDNSDWAQVFSWKRSYGVLETSELVIVWETEDWAKAGQYRVRCYGDSKAVGGTITAFEGVSQGFVLA
ncbi:unnamed protein product [Diplocarpon coronariae]